MKITFEMDVEEFNQIGGTLADIINAMMVEEETEEDCDSEDEKIQYYGSQYTRYFNDSCVTWTRDPKYNALFLQQTQRYANEKLKAKGHLFLNEVYDMLGLSKTKEGQIVGWIYNTDEPIGDNYVDFGISELEPNQDFVNGLSSVALLDFNVDGNILKYLE